MANTVKHDIFTSANFHKTSVFTLEENFTRQKFTIATYKHIHFYSCIGAYMYYTFVRQEASHKISINLHLMKISRFTITKKRKWYTLVVH